MKKKFICTVCGYVYEGEEAPEFCPQCKQPRSKFKEVVEGEAMTWADEHVIGVAKGVDPGSAGRSARAFLGRVQRGGNVPGDEPSGRPRGISRDCRGFQALCWEEAEHAASSPSCWARSSGTREPMSRPVWRRVRRLRGQEAYRYAGQEAEPGCDSRYGT